jgi:hypothetical protein
MKRKLQQESNTDEMSLLRQEVAYTPTELENINHHPLDKTITFDEEKHKYTFYAGNELITEGIVSSSTLIHKYFPVFDADRAIDFMRKNEAKFNSGRYAGLSDDEIKELWDCSVACERGTHLHFLLECHNNGYDLQNSVYNNISDIQDYFRWRDIHMKDQVPFRTELRMHTGKDLRLAGTADLLTIDKDHPPPSETGGVLSVHLKDWKFSKEIKTRNYFGKGFGVCNHLDDCNFNHYALQQNLYQWMIEHYYNDWTWNGHIYTKIKVVSKYLVVFHANHPRSGKYIVVPDMTKTIEDMLNVRRSFVKHRFP